MFSEYRTNKVDKSNKWQIQGETDFIENETGSMSRHKELSPAMSQLIIVGHVKDGIEMAREYGLPTVLRQFIETRHGTGKNTPDRCQKRFYKRPEMDKIISQPRLSEGRCEGAWGKWGGQLNQPGRALPQSGAGRG